MPIAVLKTSDPKVAERLAQLIELQAAGLKWYWRSIALVVAFASILNVIFQILTYYSP